MKSIRTRLAAGLLALAFCIPALSVVSAGPAAAGTPDTIRTLAYAQLNNPTRNYEYNPGSDCNWYTGDLVNYRGYSRPQSWNCGGGWRGEEWCADFAAWIWDTEGVLGLDHNQSGALAGAFYTYGANFGTYHEGWAAVGDAVTFWTYTPGYGWWVNHVAIVTEIYGNGYYGYIGGNQSQAVTHGVGWINDGYTGFTSPHFYSGTWH